MRELKALSRDRLAELIATDASVFTEDEALAVLDNPYITPEMTGKLAQNPRLTSLYAVRCRLVAHRQTPQAHAVKLVHYLYWFDLLRLSIDVRVPAPVRRAIDAQLLLRVDKLAIGERISSARRCSPALIGVFLFDRNLNVFEALLVNKRLREDDLLKLIASSEVTPDQLRMIAEDARWSFRYAIRKALVLNPATPRAAAASQLRHLSRMDLRRIHANPKTSVYLRRCIERILPDVVARRAQAD